MLSIHPNALFGSADNRDVFRICALHKEKGEACTESAMPGVKGKEI